MSDMRIPGIKPLPKPEVRPTRINALIIWALAALGLIVSLIISIPVYAATEGLGVYGQILLTDLIYYLPFAVLPVFLLAKRRPGLFEAYRPNPISLFNTISIVILAVLGVFFVNDITVIWSIPFEALGLNVYADGLPTAQNTAELMLGVITIAVIPAICEEFVFRGVVLSAFERYGTKHAIWASALLFMAIHGSLIGGPSQLILGMILAFIVIWSDSIYAGLIYHTTHNAALVILTYLNARWTAGEEAQAASTLEAIGGMAGIPELLFDIGLSAALIFFTLKLFRMRGLLRGITTEARQKEKLGRIEWIVLVLGAFFCVVLYAVDFIAMLGG